jgi:hypothetical protein
MTRRLCFDCSTRLIGAGVRRKDGRLRPAFSIRGVARPIAPGLDANERRLADIMRGDTVKARRGLSSCGETLERSVLAGEAGQAC